MYSWPTTRPQRPGTGEINYPYLLALLDRLGYAGWVGCEYKPAHHGRRPGLAAALAR